jgi:hypothetical protein
MSERILDSIPALIALQSADSLISVLSRINLRKSKRMVIIEISLITVHELETN